MSTPLAAFRALDALARQDSVVHRLHPGVGTALTLLFVVTVSSFPAREVSGLLPLLLIPVGAAGLAGLPFSLLARQVLRATPFGLALALPALFLDRTPVGVLGPLPLTGGMLVFASVTLRVVLSLSAALVLAATTGVEGITWALQRFGLPRILAIQVLLLHRYLHVLAAEADRMVRARNLRAFGKGRDLGTWGALVGSLLLRALARGRRVWGAMQLAGFDGRIRPLRDPVFRRVDAAVGATLVCALVTVRLIDLPELLGVWLTRGAP